MFISFRVTRRLVVIVAAILARLFFMGMDGVDRFSSDWNRVTGASMPDASRARDMVNGARGALPMSWTTSWRVPTPTPSTADPA